MVVTHKRVLYRQARFFELAGQSCEYMIGFPKKSFHSAKEVFFNISVINRLICCHLRTSIHLLPFSSLHRKQTHQG
jgi:hypothetical protein